VVSQSNMPKEPERIVMLSGGVGGARLARGLATTGADLSVVVNVGDDDVIYGVHVAPDIDTVTYTLAGIEGPQGWGIAGDTFTVMDALAELGADTTFRLGDRDLATCLLRTTAIAEGSPLSRVTASVAKSFGVTAAILPATDDSVRTMVEVATGETLDFQEYFVKRRHRDSVTGLRFDGADGSQPAPGVIEAISAADKVLLGPSNPALSIWPILAVPGIRQALANRHVTAVSPLIGGEAVKGPAADILNSLGLGATSQGVVDAYDGLVDTIVVDTADAGTEVRGVEVVVADTDIRTLEASQRLAQQL